MSERTNQSSEHTSKPNHPLIGTWLVKRSVLVDDVEHFGSILNRVSSGQPSKRVNTLVAASGKSSAGSYARERRSVEMWLRNAAGSKGINVGRGRPLYFRLYPQPYTASEQGRVFFNFPAESVPVNAMSFTFDDSFHNFAVLNRHPHPTTPSDLQPDVLTAQEVADVIAPGFPEEYDGYDSKRYIECQVWSPELEIFERAKRLVSTLGPQLQEQGIITIG